MPEHEFPIADQRGRDLGFKSFNKYVVYLIEEDIKHATKEGQVNSPQEKLTPQQEVEQMVSEMGRIATTLGIKFTIIRDIVRRVLKLHAKNEDDVESNRKAIWSYVASKDGTVEYKDDKLVAIDKNDVDQYAKYWTLHIRKLGLFEQIEKPLVIGS